MVVDVPLSQPIETGDVDGRRWKKSESPLRYVVIWISLAHPPFFVGVYNSYPLVSSNMAGWKIPELNGVFS